MPVLSLREITDDNRAAVEALVVTETGDVHEDEPILELDLYPS